MAESNINEREWVRICMAELCRKAGFADPIAVGSPHLVQRDLQFLCDNIESKTNTLISLSTMKRLLNGQFSRLPQSATLNAICQFIGYRHWQDFKLHKLAESNSNGASQATLTTDPTPTPIKTENSFSYKRYLVIAAVLIAGAIGLFAFLTFKGHKTGLIGLEKAEFSMNKTTSNDLPNTVVFHYNLDGVIADSFFIQQSWDKDRRIRIDKKNHTLTDIYLEPGYHVAKLIANDSVIRTVDVSIPTDKWFYYARERKPASTPEYVTDVHFKNGLLAMNKDEVIRSGVDIQKDHLYLQVYFPTHIEYSSDNYELHCRIRINAIKNNFCPFLMCEVFCQRNFMFFKSTQKGCSNEMKAQFGETILNGKTTDLSALGTNVNDWQDVIITVKNKNVTITINQSPVLSTSYDQSSGKITGLGFLSNGLPEVDFVNLKTLDGKEIYSNEFGYE